LTPALAACNRDQTAIGMLEVDQADGVKAARDGLLAAMRDAGYKGGENARFARRNAEIRKQPLGELASELVKDEKSVLLVAYSTAALKAATEATSTTPIVFLMSGNPLGVAAGKSPLARPPNVTGVVAQSPDAETVALIRRVAPEAARIGILFDPAGPDSSWSSDRARDAVTAAKLTPMMGTADARTAATGVKSLIDLGAQAIYVTPAASLSAAFPSIVAAANRGRVPVFATSGDLVDQGAIAAYEVDWTDHGRKTAALAVRVLKGESPGSMPFVTDTIYQLTVSRKAAAALGIALPADVTAQATRVVG